MEVPNVIDSDMVDPADEDWPEQTDSNVVAAADAGIPQAVAELARRDALARELDAE